MVRFWGLFMCHLDTTTGCKLSTNGFLCPQCQAKYCELPVECKCCGLTLVSAPHLARSYHHLFPLSVFTEIPAKDCQTQSCNSCASLFQEGRDSKVYQCPDCNSIFCCDCDLFFHEVLHSCSGCISRNDRISSNNSGKQSTDHNSLPNQNGSHVSKKIVATNGIQ